jgi:nuclease HARBI1
MDYDLRETIRNMPYRRRQHGLAVGEIYELGLLITFANHLITLSNLVPAGMLQNIIILHALAVLLLCLTVMSVEREELRPINHGNKNRLIDSFSDEECWQFLRFRKLDLHRLYALSNLPAIIKCPNGIVCPGEHAFCLLLYRISYPSRLISLQDIFGRDYTQLSRIFKLTVDLIYMHHKDKVHGNLDWYADRFDTYHEAIVRKILLSSKNPNINFLPIEVSNIFAFLDGTGLEITRPSNGAQNPFYNGYLHGHYLIFQGISFSDGLVVIEGAFPGYQPDTMVWRDSEMRRELDRIMNEREGQGRTRFKLYADKIYRNSMLVTAAYNLRNNPNGLSQWQIELNNLMSDIRVAIEWSFGKIIERNKFVSFGKSMKIQNSPVSKYYHIAILLANAHTCIYGCQHTKYFNIQPPSLEDYFAQ